MKHLFVTSALVLAAAGASAQTEKGSLLVGSTISQLTYSTSQSSARKELGLGITPTIGFFVANRLAMGAELSANYNATTVKFSNGESKLRAFEYGVAPFARYYVVDAPKHKFFGQAQYGISGYRAKYSNNQASPIVKDFYTQWGLSVGYNYFISPMVALEVQPYYRRSSIDLAIDTRRNRWGVGVGFQIFFPKSASTAQ